MLTPSYSVEALNYIAKVHDFMEMSKCLLDITVSDFEDICMLFFRNKAEVTKCAKAILLLN
jgi:hypothetical protein